jgi:hypothetical protein
MSLVFYSTPATRGMRRRRSLDDEPMLGVGLVTEHNIPLS